MRLFINLLITRVTSHCLHIPNINLRIYFAFDISKWFLSIPLYSRLVYQVCVNWYKHFCFHPIETLSNIVFNKYNIILITYKIIGFSCKLEYIHVTDVLTRYHYFVYQIGIQAFRRICVHESPFSYTISAICIPK